MKYLHTNIVSKDAKALSSFYINVFDCKLKSEGHMSGEWLDNGVNLVNANIISYEVTLPGYSDNAPYIEIFQYTQIEEDSQPSISNEMGIRHLAFEVDDVQGVMEKALQNGASKYSQLVTKEFKSGSLTFVYIKDPEGNIIEIESWKSK